MSISVELHNLGPLRAARLDLADLTLLIGDNNTGKTFFATVIHRVLSAERSNASRRMRPEDIPSQVRERFLGALDGPRDDVAMSEDPPFEPDEKTLQWAAKVAKEALETYGHAVRHSIAYAFGAEAFRLRRRTASRHASNCYLRIHNAQPRWELEIRFDSDQVTAVPPDPAALLSRVLDSDAIRETTGMYRRSPTAYDRETSARQMHYLRFLPSRVSAVLFDSWPINAIHLPADRTGIMQSYNVLAGATARQAATAGIRPIKIETLPGTSADFLSLVLEIPDGISYFGRRPSRFASQVQEFERDLRAAIEIDQRSDGMNAIVAVTSEGRFPMARASSMLSELAPLLLVLKAPHLYVDHLTIDEPEAHLHPEMQVRVASFLAALLSHGVRVVLTTHSDFFVSQFNNMIRRGELPASHRPAKSPDPPRLDRSKVRALHFSRENGWCRARKLEPDRLNGVDESTFTDVMRSQYDETAKLINELLEMVAD